MSRIVRNCSAVNASVPPNQHAGVVDDHVETCLLGQHLVDGGAAAGVGQDIELQRQQRDAVRGREPLRGCGAVSRSGRYAAHPGVDDVAAQG